MAYKAIFIFCFSIMPFHPLHSSHILVQTLKGCYFIFTIKWIYTVNAPIPASDIQPITKLYMHLEPNVIIQSGMGFQE